MTTLPKTERLLSLDVFRGMTVAGMLLVNNPGTWSAIYPPLEHARWHGWTPTDLIFPFFLFIVGITSELSLRVRRARGDDEGAILRQLVRRGALIFLFGFLHILETHSESESLVLCVVQTSTPRISEIPVEHLQHL